MKTLSLAVALLIAAPVAAHAQSQSAEELTRLLNGGPPARPAPQPQPQPQAAQPSAATTAPAPRPAPTAAPTSTPRPPQAQQSRATVATAPVVPARAAPPSPAQAAAAPQARNATPAAPAPGALSAAAVAALPFRIDLPSGVQLFEGRGAPNAKVWAVRKGAKTLAMIYAGPSSQFPIYDGEQVAAAGRVSIIVPEGTRRIAMEHLFQQSTTPNEIHVWLMSPDGADRDAAERIAQSVDPK